MFNWLKNLFKKKQIFNGVEVVFMPRGYWIKTNSKARDERIKQYLIDEGFVPNKDEEGGMPVCK